MQKIALSGKRGTGLYALVDDQDFKKLSKHSWCLDVGGGYPMTRYNKKTYRMHAMVKPAPKGLVTDHINRNKLDNRDVNLRIVTNSQNMHNVGLKSNNKSGHRGVCYATRDKKWIAQIKINYKNIVIGRFDDLNSAVKAREGFNYADSINAV